ncbi:MAG TPA: SCO family protein [Candidatus Baltobacteraceae bacterium]|jgi:protein SCO1/2|nr:SCO family protein [Candidatus Baltobacteraceae bacterium]
MNLARAGALALILGLCGCASMQTARFQGTTLAGQAAPDFTLTDHHGNPWTLSGQRGRVVALFFGYTHCADTCPATLAKLAKAIEAQGNDANNAEIAFVTVDPARDTPAAMNRYIARFGGRTIVGLTGDAADISRVEHAYHVWAQKIPGSHRSADDYDDSHSSIVYLIDRNGHERVVHDDDDRLSAFSADIHTLLQ